MSRKYKFHNPEGLYFINFVTVYWIDVIEPEHWKYSSAIDYAGGKGLMEIDYL